MILIIICPHNFATLLPNWNYFYQNRNSIINLKSCKTPATSVVNHSASLSRLHGEAMVVLPHRLCWRFLCGRINLLRSWHIISEWNATAVYTFVSFHLFTQKCFYPAITHHCNCKSKMLIFSNDSYV